MVKKPLTVVWDNEAKAQLRKAYNYIKKDSLQSAEKVKKEIAQIAKDLIKNPQFYPPDKYRHNNDGSFRAYELHHYRIAYHVGKEQITILRVRHTKMEPKAR